MSDILTVFDPATSTTTQFLAGTNSAFGTTLFWNESNVSLFLSFQNGDIMYLPAWYVRHKSGLTGSVNVTWAIHTTLNSGQVPTSEVIVESYNSDEPYPPDGPLVRQANGNTNTTTVGNTLINTGNAPGTSVIDIQPSGATSPTISADNSGNFSVSGDNAGTLTTLLQLIAGASPAVKIAAVGILTSVLGTFQVNGTTSLDNGKILTDGNGNVTQSSFRGLSGDTLARLGDTAGTGSGTFNHNLGAIPDFMAITTHTNSSQTVGYDSETSTQVHVTAFGGLSWFGFLTKRT